VAIVVPAYVSLFWWVSDM